MTWLFKAAQKFLSHGKHKDIVSYDQIFEGTLPLKVESTQIVIDCLVRKQ